MKKPFFLFLLIITACSSTDSAYTKSKTVNDQLSRSLRAPWVAVDDEGSDLALNNKSTNSFFLFNSACRKFESSNLSVLTNSMLTGIDKIEYISREKTTHQGREANVVIAQGSIDGIERYFRIMTTQKNNCIYDFALISTTMANLEKDTTDFNQFIQQLQLN